MAHWTANCASIVRSPTGVSWQTWTGALGSEFATLQAWELGRAGCLADGKTRSAIKWQTNDLKSTFLWAPLLGSMHSVSVISSNLLCVPSCGECPPDCAEKWTLASAPCLSSPLSPAVRAVSANGVFQWHSLPLGRTILPSAQSRSDLLYRLSFRGRGRLWQSQIESINKAHRRTKGVCDHLLN